MISASGMAIALITVMLWILWSDNLRSRKPPQILYVLRIALYLVVSGVLILNLVRYPRIFAGGGKELTIVAVVIGLAGAGYFAWKLTRRTPH